MNVPKVKLHLRPPRIHWRKYLERKVIILASIITLTYIMETYLHMHQSLIRSTHELTVAVFLEHTIWGIPFEG